MTNLAALVASSALKAIFGESIEATGTLLLKIRDYYRENGDVIHRAMSQSCDQAFRALEIALGGQSFFGRMVTFFTASGDERAINADMKAFLAKHPLAANPKALLASLRQVRKTSPGLDSSVWPRRPVGQRHPRPEHAPA